MRGTAPRPVGSDDRPMASTARRPQWLRRVLLLDHLRAGGDRGVRIRKLQQLLGCSRATLYRDLLEITAYVPVRNALQNGERRVALETKVVDARALGELVSSDPMVMAGPQRRALRRLLGSGKPHLMTGQPEAIRPDVAKAIERAFSQGRQLRIVYRPDRLEGGRAEYTVDPVLTLYARGSAYLVAVKQPERGVRTFRLSRIDEISVLKTKAQPHDEAAVRDAHACALKAWPGSPTEVTIRLTKRAVNLVRDYALPRQRLEKHADGSATLTAMVASLEETAAFVASWRGDARAVAPAELVELVRSNASKVLRAHRAPR